jgi:hypothetical protein
MAKPYGKAKGLALRQRMWGLCERPSSGIWRESRRIKAASNCRAAAEIGSVIDHLRS